jgi:hypothetical protein
MELRWKYYHQGGRVFVALKGFMAGIRVRKVRFTNRFWVVDDIAGGVS